MNPLTPIIFTFSGKKIGHKLSPGTHEAVLTKSRFNKADNLEITLTGVKPADKKVSIMMYLKTT